jgi:hypothetical protein
MDAGNGELWNPLTRLDYASARDVRCGGGMTDLRRHHRSLAASAFGRKELPP